MAVRLKKYFPQCKVIACTGKRTKVCPETLKRQNGQYKTCSAWAVEFRTDGKWVSLVYPDVRSRSDAERRLSLVITDRERGVLNLPTRKVIPTVKAYCEQYLKQISGVTKENTYLSKERSVQVIIRYLGDRKIDKLNSFLVENFRIDRMKKNGVSSATVNVDVCNLRGILDMARKEGLISQNPCDDLKILKVTGRVQKRAFTVDEIKLLLDVLEGKDRLMCAISLFTALRLSDVLSLQWSNIDFNNSLITVTISKTGRQEVIPISSYLLRELSQYKEISTSNYLFHENKVTHDIRIRHTNHFKYLFKQLGFKGVSFHTLRHSTATLLDEIGNDLSVTSRLLGHASIQTTAGFYIHRDMNSKREAVKKLESHVLSVIEKPCVSVCKAV